MSISLRVNFGLGIASMLFLASRSLDVNALLLSCSCPNFRSVERFLLPLGLPDRLAAR